MTNVSINDLLTKFWDLEEVSDKTPISEDGKICEELYRSTTARNSKGKYIVRLPFNDSFSTVEQNRHIAMSQFLKNEKSLMKKTDNKLMYDEVLQEYLTLGHMNSTTA